MSFVVFNGKKPAGNRKFASYEAARQQVRKWIRAKHKKKIDFFWTSNPMIGDYGYTIRKLPTNNG